jgi:hypothetical protein
MVTVQVSLCRLPGDWTQERLPPMYCKGSNVIAEQASQRFPTHYTAAQAGTSCERDKSALQQAGRAQLLLGAELRSPAARLLAAVCRARVHARVAPAQHGCPPSSEIVAGSGQCEPGSVQLTSHRWLSQPPAPQPAKSSHMKLDRPSAMSHQAQQVQSRDYCRAT